MLEIGFIGYGSIAAYVLAALPGIGARAAFVVARSGRGDAARAVMGPDISVVQSISEFQGNAGLVVECAGHGGLREHGPAVLRAGFPLVSVSAGALAEEGFARDLEAAALAGGSKLHLVSGAIGALDALSSARAGALSSVRYVGRKPPQGWIGSAAEEVLDLKEPGAGAQTHFRGSAREAALRYPKNANVAAAVALAGIGFDATEVESISDPGISHNILEIHAAGDFGNLSFSISGNSLPGNPRTSALAAMSVVRKIADWRAGIVV
jgi:aspartate dehydrogenase